MLKLFRKIKAYNRLQAIKEAGKRRRLREFIEWWNQENKDFIRKENKRIDREVNELTSSFYDFSIQDFRKDRLV